MDMTTILVSYSFFGGHAMAQQHTRRDHAFLMLIKKDRRNAGCELAKRLTQEGKCARTILDGIYKLCIDKNPKVGQKTPKIVPCATNCWYGVDAPAKDRRGNSLPAVVAK